MEKTLVIITKNYPYGTGEQYVTAELQVLAGFFEKIIIYPNDHYGEEKPFDLSLPDNVEVMNLNLRVTKNRKNNLNDYFFLLKNTLLELATTDDKKSFFLNFRWNLVNFWTQLQISKTFASWLRNEKIDQEKTVFYSYWFHKSAILLSILKARGYITRFVSRAHSVDLYHNQWGIINRDVIVPPFKMFKLKYVDKLYTVTLHGGRFLKKKYPSYQKKIFCSYLGTFKKLGDGPKKEIGAFHIVTCSGIDLNKRLNRLAAALMHINHPVKWTHFGTGVKQPELLQQISRLPNNILVDLKGNVPNDTVRDFYASYKVDLFINLSIVEGLPVSIMEAMAQGIPVLATAVYGNPEAVTDNYNGLLLDPKFTDEELVTKLNYCILNAPDLDQMGERSRETFDQRFTASKNYSSFANELILQ